MTCSYVKSEDAAMLESMAYKVTDDHRRREACLYIRQSSMHHVLEHTESAQRQYGLRQRAIALGWSDERIRTIDDDQGKSGAHSADRSGFRARLIGGQRSKAQRGELRLRLPIGLVYTETGEIGLDPDRAIVEAIELVFATFRRLGSAMQTLKWFRRHAVALPSRPYHMQGQVHWSVPNHADIQRMIRNPRYAGCFAYGRTRTRKRPDGTVSYACVAMESWQVCIPDAHVGYIDWEEYRRNQETLKRNVAAFARGAARQPAPREGRALLQSRVICGHCGHRMRVRYVAERPARGQPARWYYYCQYNVVRLGTRTCQSLRADTIDAAVSDFIVAAVNRHNIALALAVREQVRAEFEAIDRQHENRIEALRHEADLARRRFMEVDPETASSPPNSRPNGILVWARLNRRSWSGSNTAAAAKACCAANTTNACWSWPTTSARSTTRRQPATPIVNGCWAC